MNIYIYIFEKFVDQRGNIIKNYAIYYNKITSHALIIAYYGGYSQSEIAKTLNQPLGTIKTRMRQGMIRLHELIRDTTDKF